MHSTNYTSFVKLIIFIKYTNCIDILNYSRVFLTTTTNVSSRSRVEIFLSFFLLLIKVLRLFFLF